MTKAIFWTMSLATATATAIAIAMTMAPALAQASRDVTAAESAPVGATPQKVVPLQIGVPAQLPTAPMGGDGASPPRPGAMQGFGPMQTNPFPSAPPFQDSVKK